MIGSTLAPCPLLDPFEMTGDVRDDWELLEDFYEHARNLRARNRGRGGDPFGPRAHERAALANHLAHLPVTLSKLDNGGSRS